MKRIKLTFSHDGDKTFEIVNVLPRFHEAGIEQALKVFKFVAFYSAYQVNVLLSQFKRCRFKPDLARTILEHKSKVNVDHVALSVQQDVAVVPVFYVEDVAKQRVGSQRPDEVLLRFLEVRPVVPLVELAQRHQLVAVLQSY